MINAWYCVKSREVQSDTLHRQFSLWIVWLKQIMYIMPLKYKRNTLGEKTNFHTVAFLFFFFGGFIFPFNFLFCFLFDLIWFYQSNNAWVLYLKLTNASAVKVVVVVFIYSHPAYLVCWHKKRVDLSIWMCMTLQEYHIPKNNTEKFFSCGQKGQNWC